MIFFSLLSAFWTLASAIPSSIPIEKLTLPDGFAIEVIADETTYGLVEPRALQVEQYKDATLIYVGTLDNIGKQVKVLIDIDSDNSIDDSYTIYEGNWFPPASLAIDPSNGDMYLAEVNMTYRCKGNVNEKVLSFNDSNERLSCLPWFALNYPANNYTMHALHYLNFNKNGDICIALGMNCNECHPTLPKSTIQCFVNNNDLNGEIWANGIRNSFGYDFHPTTGDMWFTDNGRDDLLNHTDKPDDELNHVSFKGEWFGYPYCHSEGTGDPYQRDINSVSAIVDPDINYNPYAANNCTEGVTLAKQPMGPHVAAVGMRFYTESMFPSEYLNSIFVAEHGSWDRQKLIGYRVANVKIEGNDTVTAHDIFIEGWMNTTTQAVWGRPNSLAILPDGSLLISDDLANCIYRVYYDKKLLKSKTNNDQDDIIPSVQDNPFEQDNNINIPHDETPNSIDDNKKGPITEKSHEIGDSTFMHSRHRMGPRMNPHMGQRLRPRGGRLPPQ